MQAVERKSQMTKQHSARIIKLMAGLATFWHHPGVRLFLVLSVLRLQFGRLSDGKDEGTAEEIRHRPDIKTNDETFIILEGINLLENRLDMKDKQDGLKVED